MNKKDILPPLITSWALGSAAAIGYFTDIDVKNKVDFIINEHKDLLVVIPVVSIVVKVLVLNALKKNNK